MDPIGNYLPVKDYFERDYLRDFDLFGGEMLCGFTLTDSLRQPKRARFRGLTEFIICQFELNLLSQAIYTHSLPAYRAWRSFSAPFADVRLCFSGHGMGSHVPHSILRFAQQPSASPDTSPISLNWNLLGSYTDFFFGNYLCRFASSSDSGFSKEAFLQSVTQDSDCIACVLSPTGWASSHISQLLQQSC